MVLNFKSKIDLLPKLKMHHITIAKELLEKTYSKKDKGSIYNQRFNITINEKVKWKGGTLALGSDSAYITLSKARMKELDVAIGDIVEVKLARDYSKYGFDVPEEFTEVLKQDDEAINRFEALPMGTKRSIIYLVIQAKTSQKRIEKSIFLLENLKRAPREKTTMRHILGKE